MVYRARVVAVGTEEDMIRLCRALLSHCDWLEDPDDRPPFSLEELQAQVARHAREECGEGCGFYYGMVAPRAFGQAAEGSCRLNFCRKDCGLWTAAFSYDSDEPFQGEDWLRLHRDSGRVPMLALRASWDYARDKGMVVYTGGQMRESWEHMDECWLYLIEQYQCGYPPEEAVRRLRKLEGTLQREGSDMGVGEMLQSCADHLRDVADHVADQALLREMMDVCREKRDYEGLFVLQCHVAEEDLWETEHNARWLACLEAVGAAWKEMRPDSFSAQREQAGGA